MDRTNTKFAQWMGFILLIWLTSAGGMCLAGTAGADLPLTPPIENPLGDMEDPTSESETENDKDSDEDNLWDANAPVFELRASLRNNPGDEDCLHEDPCYKLNSPPPRF